MRRFRFGLRALIASVAILGLLLGIGLMVLRARRAPHFAARALAMTELQQRYLKLARLAEELADRNRNWQEGGRATVSKTARPALGDREVARLDGWAKTYREGASRFAEAAQAYRYAASHPWVAEPKELD